LLRERPRPWVRTLSRNLRWVQAESAPNRPLRRPGRLRMPAMRLLLSSRGPDLLARSRAKIRRPGRRPARSSPQAVRSGPHASRAQVGSRSSARRLWTVNDDGGDFSGSFRPRAPAVEPPGRPTGAGSRSRAALDPESNLYPRNIFVARPTAASSGRSRRCRAPAAAGRAPERHRPRTRDPREPRLQPAVRRPHRHRRTG
jgi:hypothetical protein